MNYLKTDNKLIECPYPLDFCSPTTYNTLLSPDILLKKIINLLNKNKIKIIEGEWNMLCEYKNKNKELDFKFLLNIWKYKKKIY